MADASEARACASLRAALWDLSRAPWSQVWSTSEALMLEYTIKSEFEFARALAMSVIDGSYVPVDAACGQFLSEDGLPGWSDEWLVERERYRQLRLHALDKCACCTRRRGATHWRLSPDLQACPATRPANPRTGP